MILVRTAQTENGMWIAETIDTMEPISTADMPHESEEVALIMLSRLVSKAPCQWWQLSDYLWEIHSPELGDKPAPAAPAPKKISDAAERKRRSRSSRVSVSFDLDPAAARVLDSLALEFGGKKAAIEHLLKNHEQRALPL